MSNTKEIVVYGRTAFCPDQARTMRFLERKQLPFRVVRIDEDEHAGKLVEGWVGHRSVPTVIVAQQGDLLPIAEPAPLPSGRSVRSFDRGSLITEPSDEALSRFLARHGLMDDAL